jgi:phosphatidylglycerol:prolipoprotein diacylglycerol transferase
MAFHGALVGVILAILLFLRKHPGLTLGILGDEVVPMISLGIFTTRIVNFINDELPGKLCLPDHPYCILFPAYADGYRYPSQIFEAILDILTLPIILIVYRMRPPDGVVAWTWFTIYGVTRTIAEIWREPGFLVLGLDGGQFVAVLQVFVGIAMIVLAYRRGARTVTRTSAAV